MRLVPLFFVGVGGWRWWEGSGRAHVLVFVVSRALFSHRSSLFPSPLSSLVILALLPSLLSSFRSCMTGGESRTIMEDHSRAVTLVHPSSV